MLKAGGGSLFKQLLAPWIPAFAGMTIYYECSKQCEN
jgi:hypothetical protein